ncbi:peroxisomal acyl-coenzyme A oxidase 1-like [Lytechinus pictus]|uniref:peroxisomal acyl-coenzyme A oxidase 1-like n=1 Tax=Lytechinus pictus TaxID=7653 RepID=UPI0030B9C049
MVASRMESHGRGQDLKTSPGVIIHPDIQKERDLATFQKDEVTLFLFDGLKALERKRYIESIIASDPHFDQTGRCTLTSKEAFDRSIKRSVRWVAVKEKYNLNEPDDDAALGRCMNQDVGLFIHLLMFIPTIDRLGTEEQKVKWLPLARQYKIIGTYAQTELGHGTNLNCLETTATYDEKTQEFILNCPSLTAMKWWPGGLAKSCTHVILTAQLIVKGKTYGPHCFIVQVRSLETHQPLPGMTLGDIGRKSSFDAIGNGFLIMDHVRIPRLNMLMKYAEVTPNGEYKRLGNPKVTYGSMILVRTKIVEAASYEIAKAITVATRYSVIRRQGSIEKNGPEVPILDYQTQQHKLFPGIAAAYAFKFVSLQLKPLYQENEKNLQKLNFSLLPELHALASGLKALTTREATLHIESCRFACGGHGVMLQSGLPDMYNKFSAACTYEGENTVLLLQVAGFLMKTLSKAQTGESIQGLGAYLTEEPKNSWSCDQPDQSLNAHLILDAYKHRAQWLTHKAGEQLAQMMGQGLSQQQAWNKSSIDLVKASHAHTQYFIVKCFFEGVQHVEVSHDTSTILNTLSFLYAIYHMEQNSGEFIADGYMTNDQLSWLHCHYLELLAVIRPNAVALVDAFDIRDEFLQSTLGSYDGNVYQRMYEYAKTSPRNRTEVHETYYKYIRPLLKGMIAKL